MKEYNFCNNCGKHGHQYHYCKNPIISLGIIAYNNNEYIDDNSKEIKYLMIRRKDSLGYVDFIRGKYPIFNKKYLLNIINEMTIDEKEKLLNNNFKDLWNELWGDYIGVQYRCEEKQAQEKFTLLNLGINLLYDNYDLKSLINLSDTSWEEPEWGFPKGRRNYNEKDINSALREFQEETGYNKNSLNLIQNILPFEEIFTGSNYKSYKHKYYVSHLDKNIDPVSNYQKSEVSKVEWLPLTECLKIIRPYNLERKDVLIKIDNIIKTYTII
jgi:ADP-ribose pyrophosphatase YjhB (NUDIX family)